MYCNISIDTYMTMRFTYLAQRLHLLHSHKTLKYSNTFSHQEVDS